MIEALEGISALPYSVTSQNDGGLLDLLQHGDHEAMLSIHKRYSKLVYAVALRMLREPSLAEDIHQEIFLQLWQGSSKPTKLRGNLGGWLTAVSRNRSIDLMRKQRPEEPIEHVVITAADDLSSECEHNIMMERTAIHIGRLPERQQRLIKMAYVEGWTHSEIAKITKLPLGTVKTVIRNALITLRQYMETDVPPSFAAEANWAE
jgi:RNA polymerase sigma-70 factor, ECF subfamily